MPAELTKKIDPWLFCPDVTDGSLLISLPALEVRMLIGIIGSGRIGSNIGRRAAEAGHEIIFSFARDTHKLDELARDVGHGARGGSPREAAQAEIVVLATPWAAIDEALAAAGPLDGRIVVDATNPYGAGGLAALEDGQTSGSHNARRMPGAKLVRAFNTLTADYQAAAHETPGRIGMFLAGDDSDAKHVVAALVQAVGFEPVDLGGLESSGLLDAPRRDGAVYGEAYAPDDAREIVRLIFSDSVAARQAAIDLRQ